MHSYGQDRFKEITPSGYCRHWRFVDVNAARIVKDICWSVTKFVQGASTEKMKLFCGSDCYQDASTGNGAGCNLSSALMRGRYQDDGRH